MHDSTRHDFILAEILRVMAGVVSTDVAPEARQADVAPEARQACIARTDPHASFFDLGLDSVGALKLVTSLRAELGVELSVVDVWEFRSPARLAAHLAGESPDGEAALPAEVQPLPASGPVAIVGVACRLPEAADLSAFWDLLAGGRNATREVPRQRSEAWAKVDADSSVPGTVNTSRAAFLENVDRFDASFFRISPREAREVDPQQRLGLELAWEALEDAGIPPDTLHGTRTGVFVGCVWSDYGKLAQQDLAGLTQHSGVGQDVGLIAGRISYVLGTHGPSLTVNTACSSSLVALHLAAQSVRAGESHVALVGGVTLMISPASTVTLARFGGLAPDGLSKAFSADADGFGRGEGGVFLVVKSLVDAIRDGDRVHAVLRGSAVNADGASNGITAPNPVAQEALLREAYKVAAVSANGVDYVEAHGTGTALGDPIEARALGVVLGKTRPPENPLRIGSVKTNVGHTEGASGLTGLLKVVLSMQHRILPQSLHAEELSPHIAWDELGLQVCQRPEVWPRERHESLVAGVSAFGWGGTNAHAVLERPPSGHVALHLLEEPSSGDLVDRVRELCGEDAPDALIADGDTATDGMVRASGATEDPSPWRVALLEDKDGLGAGRWELVCAPRQVTAGRHRPKVVFVCPPQGGQWSGMAVDLLLSEPVFRRQFLACDQALEPHLGVSMLRCLLEGERYEARIADPDRVQPMLFALQVSLAALLESLGVVPDVVVGHSIGEVAAAHVSGAISLPEAARVLGHYTGLQRKIRGTGRMAVVGRSPEEVREALAGWEGVSVAAVNGPATVIVAGPEPQVVEFVKQQADAGHFVSLVKVNVGAHSVEVDPLLDTLRSAVGDVATSRPRVPLVLSVIGEPLGDQPLDGAYWARNLRETVRFREAVEHVNATGPHVFVELCSHPVLVRSLNETLQAAGNGSFGIATLKREAFGPAEIRRCVGRLFAAGVRVAPRQDPFAGALPLLLSGGTSAALADQAARWAAWLGAHPETSWVDVLRTAALCRTHFDERAAVQVSGVAEASEALRALAEGRSHPAVLVDQAPAAPSDRRRGGKLATLFTGQGSQRLGMGRDLHGRPGLEAFTQAFGAAAAACDAHLERPLVEVIWAEEGEETALLHQTRYTQPALFVLETALFAQWQAWGVVPDVLLGHSVGELVAAHVAGVLSLQDAAALVCARGRLMDELATPGGAMASLQASGEEALAAVARLDEALRARVEIAGLNTPGQTLVSGDAGAVDALVADFQATGRKATRLTVSHAFHSPHMDGMLEAFREIAAGLTYEPPSLPVVSNVTGMLADVAKGDLVSAEYWVRHVRQAVRFVDGVAAAVDVGATTFLECGPDGVLCAMVAACVAEDEEAAGRVATVASLRKSQDALPALLRALGGLYVRGRRIDWPVLFAGTGDGHADLPTYAFQRQPYWLEAPETGTPGGVDPRAHGPFWEAVSASDTSTVAELLGIPEADVPELASFLPRLAAWHARADADAAVDSWRYEERWRPIVLPPSPHPSSTRDRTTCWLVADADRDDGWPEALTGALTQQGADVERYTAEEAVERLGAVEEPTGASAPMPVSILYLPSPATGAAPPAVEACQDPVTNPWTAAGVQALALAQRVCGLDHPAKPRLWQLTPHALSIRDGDCPTSAVLQTLWGLGRALSLEKPHTFGGQLDLPGTPRDAGPLDGVAALWLQPTPPDEGDELALRQGKLWARYLVQAGAPAGAARPEAAWHPAGTCLITGGTGALGTHLAHYLAEQGATHLVLTSRRGPDTPGIAEVVTALAEKGCTAHVVACDTQDAGAVDTLVARLSEADGGEPLLRHVFHVAGVNTAMPLEELTPDSLHQEMAGKVGGAWALHHAALRHGVELESFVLYGSIAGLWGTGGGAGYSAANAGLAGLAQHRRAQGLPATVLHWGPWAAGGMLTAEVETHLVRRGLLPMKPRLALHALGQALAEGREALAVADVDWTRLAPALAAERPRPLLHDLPQARAALDELSTTQRQAAEVADNVLRRTLLALPASERYRYLLEGLASEAAAVLGLDGASALDPHAGFMDLGIDSLMAVEIRQRVQRLTGLSVPATLTFDHPNLEAVADWVHAQLTPELREAGSAPALGPAALEEPIAVVGAGMRLPGGVTDLDSLWQVLASGTDTLRPIPAERFDLTGRYAPDPEHPGTTYVRHASLLDDVAGFDSALFGISPQEALSMDPQHRLLLEAAWSALEDAGFDPRSLKDSTTGLFLGIGPNEYAKHRGRQVEDADVYEIIGSHTSFAAGRLGYHLGLQGPALTVDTACSSSLVALHLAAEHLRSGRCDLALTGGVQVIADPDIFISLSRVQALSPDGRCKTFSAQADGYGRGEGVGMLVLMRLEDAQAQGRRIAGVLRGTAVNHDGTSSGITAPNGTSQQKVLRAALHNARLQPEDVDVVECHGTGTRLGDPIEVQALAAVYTEARGQDLEPLRLGTVKSSLGHLESAAGVAGVLKVLACFRHDALPPNPYCNPPNPHVDWARLNVQVVDALTPWSRQADRPRRAGVSAFGLSGTNAHVVLEEAPHGAQPDTPEAATPDAVALSLPLLVSGREETALFAQADRWAAWLAAAPETSWGDVLRTAALCRTHFGARAAVRASGVAEASEALRALAEGRSHPAVSVGRAPTAPGRRRGGKLATLFTGQGSQRLGMGRDLHGRGGLEAFTQAFDAAAAACDAYLDRVAGDRPLVEVIWAEEGEETSSALLHQTRYTQPALFVLETALFAQWQAWGVVPDVLLGHSVGELVAAHVAGVLSLQDTAALVCARGRLMDELATAGGAMASLRASEEEVLAAIARLDEALRARVEVAGLNTPTQTLVSGDAGAVDALAAHFQATGRKATRLTVSHAFHSPHMDGMLEAFRQVAAGLTYQPPSRPVVSNVTGKLADVTAGELVSADYWVRHVRQAVRFVDGIHTALDAGATTFLECGPGGVLCGLAAGCVSEDEELASQVAMVPSLRKNRDEPEALLSALGDLYVGGRRIDWPALFTGNGSCRVELPTYAFQRQRYWLEARSRRGSGLGSAVPAGPWPLAGSVLELPAGGTLHLVDVGPGVQEYLADHAVYDTLVVPGAFHLAVFLSVAAHCYGDQDLELSDVLFYRALTFDHPEDQVTLHVHLLPPAEDGTRKATLATQQRGVWTTHATATLGAAAEPMAGTAPVALEELNQQPTGESLLGRLSDMHIDWGPRWRWLAGMATAGDVTYGHLTPPQHTPNDDAPLAAGLIDNSFVLTMDMADSTERPDDDVPFLPFSVERFRCRANANATAWASGVTSKVAGVVRVAHLTWFDAGGVALARMEGFTFHRAPAERFLERQTSGQDLYQLVGRPVPLASPETAAQPVPLLAVTRPEDLDDPLPDTRALLLDFQEAPTDAAEPLVTRLLTSLQERLSRPDVPALERLTLCTRRAVSLAPGDPPPRLDHAAVWGFARVLRAEMPELELRLLDVDDHPDSRALVASAQAAGPPEATLREGRLFGLALAPVTAEETGEGATSPLWDAGGAHHGTVLLTGGTGALGRVVAKHLVRRHGVKHLLMLSRSGDQAEGAATLIQELKDVGATTVVLTACDVGDRDALAAALRAIPEGRPLTAVFHTAGLLRDATFMAQAPEGVAEVFAPKLTAALHLHELTRDVDTLTHFVLFSSVAGLLGSPGQANYAAANAGLDALAARRRAGGLPAISLAWGPWGEVGMAASLSEADKARVVRSGLRLFSVEQGLEVLDVALRSPAALLAPLRLAASSASPQPLLASLVRRAAEPRPGRVAGAASAPARGLAEQLAGLDAEERHARLLRWVREEVASLLGLADAATVPADQTLRDLGLDSLMAVELRNQLSARIGTKLPATLAYDYPTLEAIAALLLRQAFAESNAGAVPTSPGGDRGGKTLRQPRHADDEPIAIIAMACRTPGAVVDPDAYWTLLDEGKDAVGPFPDRWDVEALYDPDPDAVGKSYTREGGFLREVDRFDAGFFGISPREALGMDPGQRLVLEVAWEAFERAGIRPETTKESNTGVYLGSMGSDYGYGEASLDALDGYQGTGQAGSVLSGRLSYVLGLQGPAMTVDTACSSSLVTLHLACAGLRQGDCDLALAGGVHVMCTPATFVEFSRLRGIAPDGRCKAFGAAADGVGWAEGCGILLLKRLSDARRDGDRILALVRGSAVNQDGRSQGLTAPNGPSQQRVIRRALSVSGLAPDDVDAVEAHGTGTELGDPIEVGALAEVFGPTRSAERPLWLGSSKSNLGHTQAAAGVLGVMKLVQSFLHERLPKTLHAETPSEHVTWEGSGLALLQEARPWPRQPTRVRRAGVSGFGVSGTNAHVVLEEAPHPAPAAASDPPAMPLPLLVSGRDEAALRAQADRWAAWLMANPETSWGDVLRTAALCRTHFDARAAIQGSGVAEASEALTALAEDRPHPAVSVGRVPAAGSERRGGKLAVLFTGQGSQRLGMGRDLHGRPGLEAFTQAFDAAVTACDVHLARAAGDRSLTGVLWADEGDESASALLRQTRYTQPALFVLESALFHQWQAWGVFPDVLLGHSVGELVAAHLAGVLSLDDAAAMVCARGRLMDELATAGGAMASLQASEEEVRDAVTRLDETLVARVDVAGLNTPAQTLVSGDAEATDALIACFEATGRKATRLTVSHAFHSHHMDGMLEAFRQVAAGLTYKPPSRQVISNVTGKLADPEAGELVSADYWVRHVRQAVRFVDGVHTAVDMGATTFLECGPDAVLCGMAAVCVAEDEELASRVAMLPSLRKGQEELPALLSALGRLHVRGRHVEWPALFAGNGACPVELPTYAFQRQSYWLKAMPPPGGAATGVAAAGLSAAGHPLLGATTQLAGSDGLLLTGRLSLSGPAWLADHEVFGTVLMPGTGLLELALAAARAVGSRTVSELTLAAPLVLPHQGAVRVQLQVDAPDGEGRRTLVLYSRGEDASADTPWTSHATGVLAPEAVAPPGALETSSAWPPPGAVALDLTELYPRLAARGLGYGPAFQILTEAWRQDEEVHGRVVLPESLRETAGDYGIHPALLDAALHLIVAGFEATVGSEQILLIPFHWSDVTLHATGASELRVRLRLSSSGGEGEASATLVLADATGQPVATVGGLLLRQVTAEHIRAAARTETQNLYRVDWQPVELPKVLPADGPGSWLVLTDRQGVGAALCSLLEEHGQSVVKVAAGEAYEVSDPGSYRLDPGDPEQLRRLFAETAVEAWTGVVYLWSLDAGETPSESSQTLACGGAAQLVSTLSAVAQGAAPRLWLVTRGAQPAGPDDRPIAVAQATLWGLGRTVMLEHPELRATLVDLDAAGEADVTPLWREISSPDGEDQIALRGGERRVARLVRHTAAAGSAPPTVSPDASYLVTGGLGGLGLVVARWLVEQGARHLILLGRTALPPRPEWDRRAAEDDGVAEKVAAVRDLEARGAQVELDAVDVADEESLGAFWRGFSQPGRPPLRGVVHAAGVMHYQALAELDLEEFHSVLRPKVYGGWLLDRLCADLELDFFVLFSSISALLSSPLLAGYAAGNAFLDALAHDRRRRGQPALSIDWGIWGEVGMAVAHSGGESRNLATRGMGTLTSEQGLEVLAQLLEEGVTQVGVLPIDWRQWSRAYPEASRSPLLTGLVERETAGPPSTVSGRQSLLAAAPEQRGPLAESLLRQQVSQILGIEAGQLDASQSLTGLGLDSLMAMELRNRVRENLGMDLPLTRWLQGLSLEQLTADVLERLSEAAPVSSPTPRAGRAASGTGLPPSRAGDETAEGEFPLSYDQQAMWIEYELDRQSWTFNVLLAVRVLSPLDAGALRDTFQELTDRHSILRTTYRKVEGVPLQKVHRARQAAFEVVDAAAWGREQLDSRVREEARRPFDLERGPVLRVVLFACGAQEHVLLVVAHHIALDFWSLAILIRELGVLYPARAAGLPSPPLPALALGYTDYVRWQQEMLEGPEGERLEAFWRRQLAGAPPPLELPFDRPPSKLPTFEGAACLFALDRRLTDELRALAEDRQATLFATLLAAFQVLLQRLTGQDDVVVSSPMAGRSRSELTQLVGHFVHLVPLRSDLSGAPRFSALLGRVQQTVLEALEHQEYPALRLARLVPDGREKGRTSLFDVELALNSAAIDQQGESHAWVRPGARWHLTGLDVETLDLPQQAGQFDLGLELFETRDGLAGFLQYRSDLFDPTTARRLLGCFRVLLEGLVTSPDEKVSALPFLTRAERHQLVVELPASAVSVVGGGVAHGIYVLDRQLRGVALGCVGRIAVDGAGRGPDDPEAIPNWVPNPFSWRRGECLFLTGQAGRLRASGELELLGDGAGGRASLLTLTLLAAGTPAVAAGVDRSTHEEKIDRLLAHVDQLPEDEVERLLDRMDELGDAELDRLLREVESP